MTILNITSSLSWGGMERDHFYLASELVKMGHNVHTAYLYGGEEAAGTAQRLAEKQVTLHRLRALNNHDPFLVLQILRIIRNVKPDIIHTWQLQMDILGGIAGRIAQVPCVLMEPSCAQGHPDTWKERFRLRLGAGFEAIVSNSRGGDDYWRTRCPESRRHIVLNGYPLEEISGARPATPADTGRPAGQKYLLYAGRLVSGKGLESLIKAFAPIAAEYPVSLVFCGEGPLRQKLEKEAGFFGTADRVSFTGFLPNNRVWSLMKSAEAFIFPSEFEGRPNVVMEALACGCPLIISDIPAHREFLDESTALFTDPKNPEKIAGAVRALFDEPQATRNRAEAGQKKIRDYSLAAMAAAYAKIYRDSYRQK